MATFLTDTFTDSNGTALSSHTGELGATWTAQTGNAVTPQIQGNSLDPGTGADANALWYASASPASADYSVTADVLCGNNTNNIGGPALRLSTSDQTGYYGFILGGAFAIYKYVAGALSSVASVSSTVSPTVVYAITLAASGTTLTLTATRSSDGFYLKPDGTWQAGAIVAISTTDSSISAAGMPGFWLSRNASDSAKLQSISANETGGGGGGGGTPLNVISPKQGMAFSSSAQRFV